MRNVVIDVDVGVDDYLSLVYLLNVEKRSDVKILAIICTNGNTSLDNVIKNVVRLLEVAGRTDIPVYKGANNPLLNFDGEKCTYHGLDGFGDLEHENEPDLSIVQKTPGVVALNDIIKNNPQEITVICLGPLTTLALAIKVYDDLIYKIKDLWIMGGNYTGVGNVSCSAEFNFYTDPEAASIVLENVKCPIYILPWETCVINKMSLDFRLRLLSQPIPELALLFRAEEAIGKKEKITQWVTCDTYLVFCFVQPDHITKSELAHASVELNGRLTRGQVVIDHLKRNKPNVTIIKDLDKECFMEELLTIQ